MKLTFKKDVNLNSIVLRHNIILETMNLIEEREGALQTEIDLYLILSIIDNLVEENIIEFCNEDTRPLVKILAEEIEPVFFDKSQDEVFYQLYMDTRNILINIRQQRWEEEHSFTGLLKMIFTVMSNMSEEDKKEVLKETGKIAEAAFERRTEELKQEAGEINDKLGEFVRQYQEKLQQANKDTK